MARFTMGTGLTAAASLAVAAAIAAGITVIEGPERQRERRFDQVRVANLNQIASGIDCYRTLNGELPSDLDKLVVELENLAQQKPLKSFCVPGRIRDPKSDEPYGYRQLDETRFELCAVFSLATPKDQDARVFPGHKFAAREWKHLAGPQCFALTAVKIKQPIFE